jgi:hypothetical protein
MKKYDVLSMFLVAALCFFLSRPCFSVLLHFKFDRRQRCSGHFIPSQTFSPRPSPSCVPLVLLVASLDESGKAKRQAPASGRADGRGVAALIISTEKGAPDASGAPFFQFSLWFYLIL